MKVLTINHLVDKLKEFEEFKDSTKKSIRQVIEATFVSIQEEVLKGNEVKISDFGKFIKVTRQGVSNGFGKSTKYKNTKIALKPFKSSKIKG